ncbi:MAG TPA: FkbM family methyltransferase [Sediminispirochaeta sp.]|nr:FkbM family methyltransferase [Sediminispirochaeta sp.]
MSGRKRRLAELEGMTESSADAELIRHIEKLRRRIMKGPGSALSPRTDPTPEESWELHLRGLTLSLAPRFAPASIDSILDIFVDRIHRRCPGFGPAENQRILDIGANEGFYSLAMCVGRPDMRVVSLEPDTRNYQLLRRNIALNFPRRIETYRLALWDQSVELELSTHPWVNTISSVAIENLDQSWVDPRVLERQRVPALSLDELARSLDLADLDLIKIDVEGAEAEVLRGGRELLSRTRRVVVEVHGGASRRRCTSILRDLGFVLKLEEAGRFGDLYFRRRRGGMD